MITGFEGLPGQGKTLSAVETLWRKKKAGKPVYANIPLFDYRVKRPRRYWGFGAVAGTFPVLPDSYGKSWADGPVNPETGATLDRLEDVFLIDNGEVLIDEAHLWCPAQEWDKLPFGLRVVLAQQRKQGLNLYWTAQNVSNVFNIIRQLTWCCFRCVKWGRVVQLVGRDPNSGEKMPGRWLQIGGQTINLYDTRYMVGTRDGHGAKVGATKRYDRSKPALSPAEDGPRFRRVDLGFGQFRYVVTDEPGEEEPPAGAAPDGVPPAPGGGPSWAFG